MQDCPDTVLAGVQYRCSTSWQLQQKLLLSEAWQTDQLRSDRQHDAAGVKGALKRGLN